jgi:hypothetical protein
MQALYESRHALARPLIRQPDEAAADIVEHVFSPASRR